MENGLCLEEGIVSHIREAGGRTPGTASLSKMGACAGMGHRCGLIFLAECSMWNT